MAFERIALTALSYERRFTVTRKGVLGMSHCRVKRAGHGTRPADALLKVVTSLPARGYAAPRIPMIYSARHVT